jgi:hypothetical protein
LVPSLGARSQRGPKGSFEYASKGGRQSASHSYIKPYGAEFRAIPAWSNNSGALVTPLWSRQAYHTSPKRKRGLKFASLTLRANRARLIADIEPCRDTGPPPAGCRRCRVDLMAVVLMDRLGHRRARVSISQGTQPGRSRDVRYALERTQSLYIQCCVF